MNRVAISAFPFADPNRKGLDMLEGARIRYRMNPHSRRLTEDELIELIQDSPVLVAGTDPITERVMASAPNLKLIARVGIGLDSVDLKAARERRIAVTYSPDGPAPAVAELTVGLMIDLLRGVSEVDRGMRVPKWNRAMGRRLELQTVGVIGVGRIGKRVIRILRGGFPGVRILANDLAPDHEFGDENGVEWLEKAQIFREADIVTLHVPLTPLTRGLVTGEQLKTMKPSSLLINTARGGLVDGSALAEALGTGTIARAALDVFETEPYEGPLTDVPNCILTCHMGSMTADCRLEMEIGAVREALRYFTGEPSLQPVPESEYSFPES